jgi:hypothetical protein
MGNSSCKARGVSHRHSELECGSAREAGTLRRPAKRVVEFRVAKAAKDAILGKK